MGVPLARGRLHLGDFDFGPSNVPPAPWGREMFTPLQRTLVAHAALILLIAMLAGIGLLASLVGGLEVWPGHILTFGLPASPAAWARTHAGGILNALLILAVALIVPGLGFSEGRAKLIGWLMIGTG